ncbi:MAG: integrin alpha [Planctomycetota bacterium]
MAYIDSDPYLDVVIAAPQQDVGTRIHQGRVYIFWGPWNALAPIPYASYTVLDVESGDVDSGTNHGGKFGSSISIGPLDDQGGPDIAVGAPYADDVSISPSMQEAGAVDLFLNPPKAPGSLFRHTHLYQQPGQRDAHNNFGWALAIGEFGNSAGAPVLGDVVIGAPGTLRAAASRCSRLVMYR